MNRFFSEDLQRIYSCSADEVLSHNNRFKRLHQLFADSFGGKGAEFIVRAPGRVNLIGEHTDYNGYPVLPMALDREIVLVISPRKDATIRLRNQNPYYTERIFTAALPLEPFPQGDWGNFVKAALSGLLEVGLVDVKNVIGFDAIVGGTIPESAGLSSSSAMVVGSALAFLAVNKVEADYKHLADLMARAERYVGSEGGGMDQAASLLAEPQKALRIDFFPLRVQTFSVPEGISFVICNSLVRASKSESAQYAYNLRVVEGRLAAALLAQAVEQKFGRKVKVDHLSDLSAEKLGVDPSSLMKLAAESMGDRPLSLKEIGSRLHRSAEDLERKYCTSKHGTVLKEPPGGFQVWHRYRHVITETERVDHTVSALKDGNIHEVGKLMSQSHASCRDDYEVSCPELDTLVSLGVKNGALGGRLTGAGFGGCTVHAVPSDRVDNFIRGVTDEYYHGYVRDNKNRNFIPYGDLQEVMFRCRASAGACVWSTEQSIT